MVGKARWVGLGLTVALAITACGGGGGGGTPSVEPARTVLTTTATNPQGWGGISDHCLGGTPTGAQGFLDNTVVPNPPRGAGSYGFAIGADGDSIEALGQIGFGGTKLADLSELTLAGYVAVTSTPGLGPTVVLTVDRNADGTWDDVNDDVLAHIPTSAGVGAWQSWNTLGGASWCSATACGTMADYVSANPTATLIDAGLGTVSIGAGCLAPEYDNYEVAIDVPAIGVGTTIIEYDFEP